MPTPAPAFPASAEAPRRKLLLADDDAVSRRVLSATLSAAGFEVWTAGDGAEAMQAIESSPPDLLVLDFEMPQLNGAELCRKLRASEREAIRQLPVIMLTGHAGEADEVACLDAGANDFVTKPVGREVLLARIETQLRLGALSDELRAQNSELARWRALQEADLDAAKVTQQAIVALTPPTVPGWKVDVAFLPLIQVGGDAYGWRRLADGRWLFWIADATGHGVSAALFTTLVAWLFHHAAFVANSAAEMLATVNEEFWSVMRGRSFMTACCAIVDAAGALSFAGAGHPPLIVRRANGATEALLSLGTMLGVVKSMSIESQQAQLAPGDLALLYTDGLFSLRSSAGARLDHSAVVNAVARLPSSNDGVAEIVRALRAGAGTAEFEDDVAAIVLRRVV